ncbi:hypothetical protein GCM10020367_34490 [Streptomyces sannanensis]|uniref:DUF4232 domain-containing protein n=1 Tax=Streptomyces sannanensis TaxID=285536 RepID=A0ABP6SD87_9ACTN
MNKRTPENEHEDEHERYRPDGPLNDDRTGNDTVNDGPDNHVPGHGRDDGADGVEGSLDGCLDGGADEIDPPALDELSLRRLMQSAVEDLEPSESALDHLRTAVPARRARRRQIAIGTIAAALLVGTAVPAFVHVANSGSLTASPSIAGHGERAEDDPGAKSSAQGGKEGAVGPSGPSAQSTVSSSPSRSEDPETGKETGTTGGGGQPDPSRSAVTVPGVCEAGQLGLTTAQVGSPDAEGKVYGTFRVANVSGTKCVVGGAGTVSVQARGAADPARVTVVEHTQGDPAAGLPDTSQETSGLVLAPAEAYEVRFAWVPSDTCPTVPPTPEPSPTTGTSSGETSGESTPMTNAQPQLAGEGGGQLQDGGVEVGYTPAVGGPSAGATISNACAGTIYRTGVLRTS